MCLIHFLLKYFKKTIIEKEGEGCQQDCDMDIQPQNI